MVWLLLAAVASRGEPSALPLGVNLENVTSWHRAMMFVDTMKGARPFGSPGTPWDQTEPVDANGWPTNDAGVVVLDGSTDPVVDTSGTYHLSFNGTGGITPMALCSITNQVYDPVKDLTTADVIVPLGGGIALSFTQTHGGVRNVKCIRPGYPADTTQVFHTPFLNVLSNFSVLRGIAYSDTWADNPVYPAVQPWSSHRPAHYATQMSGARYKGGSWEYLVELANAAGKDLWLNVPIGATDDYVTQLACLLKTNLQPDRIVYVELSNEVWNYAPEYPQTVYNNQAAAAEVQAGGSPLNYDGSTDAQVWGRRRVAKRLVEIVNLFKSVYGPAAINTTIRPVLAHFIRLPFGVRDQLEFIEAIYGPPSQFLYGISGAPYVESTATATLDQIFAGFTSSSDANRPLVLHYRALASYYGLKLLAYEGGPNLTGDTDLSVKIEANRDPRITALMVHDLADNWYAAGGDLCMLWLSGAYSKYGTTSIYEDITKPSAKSQAIEQILSSPRPALNAGAALPALGQAVIVVPAQGFGLWGRFGQYGGSSSDILLQGTNAATYSVTLNFTNAPSGTRLQVLVDNQLCGTVAFPSGNGNAPAVPMTLGPGLHTMRLADVVGNGSLQAVGSVDIQTTSSPPGTNTAPAISSIGDQIINQDTPTAPIPFTVGDAEPGNLTLRASSSNEGLVAVSDVVFRGSGPNRTMVITPTPGQSGTAQIGISVVDSGGLSSTTTFTLTVRPGDFIPPVLSAIGSAIGTASEVTIVWTTSEPSDSQVEFGLTTAYGSLGALPSMEPGALNHLDVGNPRLAGSVQRTTNGNGGLVYTIVGGGSAIGYDVDSFHYAFTEVAGDFDYVATVHDLQGLAYWAKAGLMARAWTNAVPTGGDPFFAVLAAPSGGGNEVVSHWRASRSTWGQGASASPVYRPSYPDTWLRLRREGSTFVSLASTNGLTWTELTRRDLSPEQFSTNLLIGLAVTAENDGDPLGAAAVFGRFGALAQSSLTTNHTVTLRGLTGGTLYHYRVFSRDAAGNVGTAQDFTFQTPPATKVTTINISAVPAVTEVKRLGVNLEWYNFYDSGQIMKNLVLRNAGFEGLIWQSTLRCTSGTATSCIGEPPVGWPDGFWDGASYEFIWGAAQGRTGTVTTFTAPVGANGPAFQFGDSGISPANGDYLILRKTMPGAAVSGWWPRVEGSGSISTETNDLPPGTEGHQAIRLTALGQGNWSEIDSYFDTWGRGKTFLQLNGRYRISFKAKGVGGANQLSVSLGRGTTPTSVYFEQSLTLSDSWNSYAGEFTAAEDGTVLGSLFLTFSPSGSSILLDDVSLMQIDTDAANPTAFRDPLVNALKALRPGILRYNSQYQLGDTLDNLLAPPYARQRSGHSANATTSDQVGWGLHEFLELCEVVGAEPWFTFPITFSPTEMVHLMEYLGGGSETPYGAIRAARGHPAPWTSAFTKTHLEFGNEAWNSTYRGGSMEYSIPYGNRANELFGAAKNSPHYLPARFNFVLGGQAGWVNRNVDIANACTNHDSFGLAPYIGGPANSYADNEEMFGPLFAEAERVDQSGHMHQNQAVVQNSVRPVPIAVYEVNSGPSQGAISQAALDAVAPSLGNALAAANHMLMMLRDLGVRDQAFYCLDQYAGLWSDGKLVKQSGAVVDTGVTDHKRPQFLALQLANEALDGDLLQTSLFGDNPTWNQPLMNGTLLDKAHYVQAYAFAKSNRTSLILFNLSRSASLPVNFSGSNAPSGAVVLKRLTSEAITNNNESTVQVRTTSLTLPGFGSSQPFLLPPYSMTLLQWPATPASASMLVPPDGATFQAPASVILSAAVSDPDANLEKIEFFAGASKLGEVAAPPFTFAWTNVGSGVYLLSVRAVGLAGVSSNSVPVHITVAAGPLVPTIVSQPSSTSATAGSKASFGVVANGASPLVYQWLFNGINLGQASTDSSLTLNSVRPCDAGDYAVVVSNYAGVVTSASFTLTVLPGYRIGLKLGADQLDSSLSPTNVAGVPEVAQANWNNLYYWAGAVTNVMADGAGTNNTTSVSVQWDDPSGVWSSVREDAQQTNGAGFMVGTADHSLMAGCLHGNGPNPAWIVISNLPPELTSAGYDIYVYALSSLPLFGGGYRVLDAADGHVIRNYVGARSPANPTNYIQVPADLGPGQYGLGTYMVFDEMTAANIRIEAWPSVNLGVLNPHWPWSDFMAPVNAVQLVTRPKLVMSVNPPTITVPPQSQIAGVGSSPTFQVVALGTTPLAYQWQFDGVDLIGATNATFTLSNVRIADDGSYTVIVRNPAGSVTSASARLTVTDRLDAPIITAQPQPLTVGAGHPAAFSVAAARTAISSYQWRFNGDPIPGATSASLIIGSVQLADGGNYSVTVANAAGSASSFAARLTVLAPPTLLAATQTAGAITLSWNAIPGQTYQVQYATNLTQPLWLNLVLLTAANPTVTASDTVGADAQRFYRIVWLP
jgi:hypothetical protein